jgi:enamine deaminase RidA (YjgF/YER057c/UK114 family)
MPIERLQPGPRMSQAVIHNKTVYLAGQVADEAAGKGVAEQTRDILSTIDALLAQAKTDKTRILSATIWLTSMWRRALHGRERRWRAPNWRVRSTRSKSP